MTNPLLWTDDGVPHPAVNVQLADGRVVRLSAAQIAAYTETSAHATLMLTPTREPCVRCGQPLDNLTGWYVVAGGAVCGGCLGAGETVRAQAR